MLAYRSQRTTMRLPPHNPQLAALNASPFCEHWSMLPYHHQNHHALADIDVMHSLSHKSISILFLFYSQASQIPKKRPSFPETFQADIQKGDHRKHKQQLHEEQPKLHSSTIQRHKLTEYARNYQHDRKMYAHRP